MRNLVVSLSGALTMVLMLLTACTPRPAPVLEPAPTERAQVSPTPQAPNLEPSATPTPAWQSYQNSPFGIRFEFPMDWYGPDVYEVENVLRLAVGSDVVHPYGESPETNTSSAENSYQVVIQYTLNSENWTLEQYRQEHPWLDDYVNLLELKDGESTSTIRSLTTRVRELELGRFAGAEFIHTLPETAQTEPVYFRSAFLYDEHLNVLLVTGSPYNVAVSESGDWRAAFLAVDDANLDVLWHILDSLVIE